MRDHGPSLLRISASGLLTSLLVASCGGAPQAPDSDVVIAPAPAASTAVGSGRSGTAAPLAAATPVDARHRWAGNKPVSPRDDGRCIRSFDGHAQGVRLVTRMVCRADDDRDWGMFPAGRKNRSVEIMA